MNDEEKFYEALKTVFKACLKEVRNWEKLGKKFLPYFYFPKLKPNYYRYQKNAFTKIENIKGKGRPIDYKLIFDNGTFEDYVDFSSLDGAETFKTVSRSIADVRRSFSAENTNDEIILKEMLDQRIEEMVIALVDLYIHHYNYKYFDVRKFDLITKKYINCIFEKEYFFTIFVPILGCSFDFDKFNICEDVDIIRMDELLQLSRHNYYNKESKHDKEFDDTATHALKIENYFVESDTRDFLRYYLFRLSSDLISIIDDIFSSFKITLHSNVGYSQVFCELHNGEFNFSSAYLKPITGTTMNKFNPKIGDFDWFNQPKIYSRSNCKEVKNFFSMLAKKKDRKCLELALSKFNESFLRNSKEEAVLDRLIGLESLLTEDCNTEITYRMGIRASYLLSSYNKKLNYKKIINNLYSYRSAIVHGSKNKEKKSKFKLDDIYYDCENISKEIFTDILKKIISTPKYNISELGLLLDDEIVNKFNN